ncbi:MAG: DUF721 domain-containing protein [Thermodesulfobacteria bacterium]|nr:DUF721 domain-containing protein [Thermodesulfobacteriota bacterium]
MQAFKEALKCSGLPPKVLKRSLVLGKIRENWEKIVGDSLKDWAKPLELREDTLVIGVAHSYLSQSFASLSLEVLRRINRLLKNAYQIKRIQIKVCPRLYEEVYQKKKKERRSFDEKEVKKCFELLENLKDSELKKSFLNLFKVYFSR